MRQHKVFTLATLLLVLAIACSPAIEAEKVEKTEKVVPVALAPVQPLIQNLAIQSSGVVGSREEVKLAFKIGGVIQAVYVNEGDFVKKGQLIARLNAQEIDAQVLQARAGLEKAERDLGRISQLYEDTVATYEQLQDLTTAKEVAEANLRIARFNKKYAEIYAPARGRILKKFAEKGEIIGAGNPVYLLAAAEQSQVIRIGISDREVVQIALGDEALVRFDAFPGKELKARVSEIAAGANPRNGTFEVELALESEGLPIKNGFIGKVKLFPSTRGDKLKLPLSSMVEATAEQLTLYTLDSTGTRARQLILSNYQLGDSFLVVPAAQMEGIEKVITEGAHYLGPHTAVKLPQNQATIITQK